MVFVITSLDVVFILLDYSVNLENLIIAFVKQDKRLDIARVVPEMVIKDFARLLYFHVHLVPH